MTANQDWIKQEFETINLADPRLHKRFLKVVSELSTRLVDSIHSASAD